MEHPISSFYFQCMYVLRGKVNFLKEACSWISLCVFLSHSITLFLVIREFNPFALKVIIDGKILLLPL